MPQDEYWLEPQGTYESRRAAFLEYAAAAEGGKGRGGFFSQLCRLELDRGPIDEESIRDAVAYVNARHDCADFTVSGLLRLMFLYGDSPLLPPELIQEVRDGLRNFKYWIDEPGYDDLMCFWSENHQIMFHSDEYLAGQLFPDEIFSNAGQNGRWHMEKARKKICNWISLKAKVGFSEWDSNCYYDEDMTPLLNLADFAKDGEIATRAAMILDVMFFDMAVDSFRGTYGTSHGRTYPGQVLSGRREATSGVQKIAWGMGNFNNPNNMTAVCLATSPRYRVPKIIGAIARHMPEELENFERQSLKIAQAERYGIRFDDLETAMLIWGAGKFANQRNVEDTLKLADQFHSHRFDVVIRPYAEAVQGTYRELDRKGIAHDGDLDRTTLAQVDKYTYRTPDYQLSCAQDYRKGKPGFQQHIWQATLGPDAVVFALHRGSSDEKSYKYWVGRFPRVGQYKNLLIAVFNIPDAPLPGPKTQFPPEASGNAMPSPGPSEEELLPRTVAVFNRSAFDEVIERNNWIFARKNKGYLALRSQNPVQWTPDGVLQGEGLIAEGRHNIWICQLGREAFDGPFNAWIDRIAKAHLTFDTLSVAFDAPGIGPASFGWEGALTIAGKPIALGNYPRFKNPYCTSGYESGQYEIAHETRTLILDFATGKRHTH